MSAQISNVNSGSFKLGKNISLAPGAKKTVRIDLFGVSQAYKTEICIWQIYYKDGTKYVIPDKY